MKVPKYIQELMGRAYIDLTYAHPKSSPGYTVRIYKATPYAHAETLYDEAARLVAWANRQPCGPETAGLLDCPTHTHYRDQYALVNIFDPVMQALEKFIPATNAPKKF